MLIAVPGMSVYTFLLLTIVLTAHVYNVEYNNT